MVSHLIFLRQTEFVGCLRIETRNPRLMDAGCVQGQSSVVQQDSGCLASGKDSFHACTRSVCLSWLMGWGMQNDKAGNTDARMACVVEKG